MATTQPDLKHKLHDVPHKPGIYVMRDRLKHVIYVGKARDLRKRLSHYLTPSRKANADRKTRALIESIWDFEWHTVGSEAEAVLYEGKLIKEFRPKYNISFRDDKRFLLLKVNLNEPFPRFQLTRLRQNDGASYFGPFADSRALRATLNAMRKKFGIRACTPFVPTERDYKHCLNHVIKCCSAPCVAKISQGDYAERIRQACAFLEGASREMLDQTEVEMKAAAEKLDFEKAARLRDLLESLRQTIKPMTRFTRKSLPTTLDPEADLLALKDALHLEHIPYIMECFDISNISTAHIVASMVRFRNGVPDRSHYRRYRITSVRGQNDFASMAEVVRRRYARALREIPPDIQENGAFTQESPLSISRQLAKKNTSFILPDLIIVDGGKGQLSSACQELQRLGLSQIPIIGLAKEFEEIYRPHHPLPLQLPTHDNALHLLQRIRDEAHRFANAYHGLLLKKRVRESVLDDIPGISESRKKALLSTFRSVERIRKADIAALSAIPGISVPLASTILGHLKR